MVETLSKGVGERIVDRLFTPAFLFWASAAGLYLRATGELSLDFLDRWSQIETLAAAAIFIMVVSGSSFVVEYLHFPVLRLLEGYWPQRLQPLRQVLVARWGRRYRADRDRWRDLNDNFDSLSADERREYAHLDAELSQLPSLRELMPTQLGNVMKAAELHAWRRYRLASVIVWPRLWLAMPQEARDELAAARRRLDRRIGLFIWSALFTLWSFLSPWVVFVTVVGLVVSYRAAVSSATIHGELYRAAFDLYHRDTVCLLGWDLEVVSGPLPREIGEQVTQFLFGGQRPR